jgi:hypothetical protein
MIIATKILPTKILATKAGIYFELAAERQRG